MADESLYITTNEAALAVVATAMKKARLSLETLILNSFMGGLLFSSGGMLHVLVRAGMLDIYKSNPAVIELIQGLVYPIGLFYVVILGVDLFNSNILFFSVGLARGAVSIFDLLVSWFVSWWFNLVGNIFVCYIICHYSEVTSNADYVQASIDIVVNKASFTFVQTLLKAMAGNFYVCLAIYLQLMAKPIHVKLIMMTLPIFTFVSLGYTHSVADMYMLIIGLINGAPVSVGTIIWKVMIPGVIGNIIGGSFFGLVIPWYLHIVVVEKDIHLLRLPKYEYRDEQPELNQDSRVVRVKTDDGEDVVEDDDDEEEGDGANQEASEETQVPENDQDDVDNEISEEDPHLESFRGFEEKKESSNTSQSGSGSVSPFQPPIGITRSESTSNMSIATSRFSGLSRYSTRTRRRKRSILERSPKNVFPVYGMGPPLARERTIASGRPTPAPAPTENINDDPTSTYDDAYSSQSSGGNLQARPVNSAEFIGEKLKNVISRRSSRRSSDLERQMSATSTSMKSHQQNKATRRQSTVSRMISRGSFSMRRGSAKNSSLGELERKLSKAGITARAAQAADDIAGVTELPNPPIITKPPQSAVRPYNPRSYSVDDEESVSPTSIRED